MQSKYKEQGEQFLNAYEFEKSIYSPDEKIKDLKHASLRVCRFCKRKNGQTTFKKEAHIIPYALGNRYLVSDFECDECNAKFSVYEDALVKYLGISRTISKTQGRNKTPGFVSKNLTAKKDVVFEDHDCIKIATPTPDTVFKFDAETNCRTITYKKPPYSPIYVYKALLKMAMSCIDERDLDGYEATMKFLLSDKLDSKMTGLRIFGFRLPNFYENVSAFLYRKRDDKLKTTTHCLVLFYSNYQIQIFLPFFKQDSKHYPKLNLILIPPLFDGTGNEKWNVTGYINDDLSSSIKRENDEETIYMYFDERDEENMVAIDPVTRKEIIKEYDPNNIAGFYIMKENFTIKIEE